MSSRGSSDASSYSGHAEDNYCRIELYAWLPHNLFNSDSSTNTNTNTNNIHDLEHRENSVISGGPLSSFPLLPHEIVMSSRQSLGSSASDEVAGVPGGGFNGRDVSLPVAVEERQIPEFEIFDPYADEYDEQPNIDIYRDMRIDVDSMSYEELVALEERIGSVSSGVSRAKTRHFIRKSKYASADLETCCICQEDYAAGDDVGKLNCDHEFHIDCIEQWLIQKNTCPICKVKAIEI